MKTTTNYSRHKRSQTEFEDCPLSQRELEVLRLLAYPNRNEDIALFLDISDQTVKNHIRSIFSRLAVSSRTQAVLVGIIKGWVEMPGLQELQTNDLSQLRVT